MFVPHNFLFFKLINKVNVKKVSQIQWSNTMVTFWGKVFHSRRANMIRFGLSSVQSIKIDGRKYSFLFRFSQKNWQKTLKKDKKIVRYNLMTRDSTIRCGVTHSDCIRYGRKNADETDGNRFLTWNISQEQNPEKKGTDEANKTDRNDFEGLGHWPRITISSCR